MKKIAAFLVVISLVLGLAACAAEEQPQIRTVPMETVKNAVCDVALADGMEELNKDYVNRMLKLSDGDYDSYYAAISSISLSISEFGIFKAKDAAQVADIENALNKYLENRRAIWMDEYLADEYPKLENASVHSEGLYVCYFILDEDTSAAALKAFKSSIENYSED